MFAVYGKRAPWITGEVKQDKVAEAVVRAIRRDIQEIIVTPGPVTLIKILDAIHPGIVCSILRLFGVYDFYRKQAEDNEKNLNTPF